MNSILFTIFVVTLYLSRSEFDIGEVNKKYQSLMEMLIYTFNNLNIEKSKQKLISSRDQKHRNASQESNFITKCVGNFLQNTVFLLKEKLQYQSDVTSDTYPDCIVKKKS